MEPHPCIGLDNRAGLICRRARIFYDYFCLTHVRPDNLNGITAPETVAPFHQKFCGGALLTDNAEKIMTTPIA
jgi:hypothetical protein